MHVFGITLFSLVVVCRLATAFRCCDCEPLNVCKVQLGELVWYGECFCLVTTSAPQSYHNIAFLQLVGPASTSGR
ncbi:hypothetical protein PGT21_005515 [Puccinia graminis f. sp. tritici]|uniref:Secreted protein n=1 Tax=Puccinia graminis f. sp. tritici TaxID=56615 RepID=A0A5B0PN45_PUCGR|nr:hypothetical protein PGT21_005515 [Puccinia graminis f. sp. tritici]